MPPFFSIFIYISFRYEKNKMKYYYAIAECDSPRTAAQIYDQCDDMEFLDSSITLDLRYVPDNQVFKNKPRDEVPHSLFFFFFFA